MKPIIRYCITHATPLLPAYWYDEAIALGDYAPESPLHISRLDDFWHRQRPFVYGAAGSYAMPRVLAQTPPEYGLVAICTFRKAILRRPLGRLSTSYASMRELDVAEAEPLDASEMSTAGEHEFLLAQPLRLPSGLFHQYAQAHELVDLLDYTSLAISTGVLSKSAAADFVKEQVLIPGGCELGIYPRAWLAATLAALGGLARLFLETHAARIETYDPYQIRALGFLSERLGSFLLLQELARRYPQGHPAQIFGHITTLTEERQAYAHGLTPAGRAQA